MKSEAGDLAVMGGPPAFRRPLYVGRPNVGDRAEILQSVGEVIDSRWLTNGGEKLQDFEDRLSELMDGAHCVATANATLGLQITMRALGVAGEVVLPSLTFVATAHAVAWERLIPVFADVEESTFCMGPAEAAARIGQATGALLGVHLWGRSADVEGLESLARERELPLIFDAAHALACSRDGRPLATFGDAAVLSFHATKIANAFEGGVVVTRNAELAERVAMMRNFGFVNEDEVASLGINAKLSEAGAAMGIASLGALDGLLATSRRNYLAYIDAFDGIPGVKLLEFEDPGRSNCHHISIEVDPEGAGLTREDLRTVLVDENVLVRRYFYPGCHRTIPYSETEQPPLPVTERALERCISLPTGTVVSESDIELIGAIARTAVGNSTAIRRQLES